MITDHHFRRFPETVLDKSDKIRKKNVCPFFVQKINIENEPSAYIAAVRWVHVSVLILVS